MSAMKNLLENLVTMQVCMADIARTVDMSGIESPLARHGKKSRKGVVSVTDARAVAAEIDVRDIVAALDDGQIEAISEQVQVDYEELASEISPEGLARYVDCAAVAKEIDYKELVAAMEDSTAFMHDLTMRLIGAVLANPVAMKALTTTLAEGVTERWYGRNAIAPVLGARSDADPETGIEYGTPS